MSRYDWGQRHPGIDRLEEQISEARGAVIRHPVYAALDSKEAGVPAPAAALAARARLWDGILAAIGERVAAA
jgi:hypothetical protein